MKGWKVLAICLLAKSYDKWIFHVPWHKFDLSSSWRLQNDDLKQVAKLISEEAKEKYSNPKIPNEFKRGRIVVITQEEKPVLVARTGQKSVDEYPVTQVVKEKIIDTNGAGDAFTGGFLAMYVQNKPFETCMKAAIYCATECIQLSGCAFPKENKFKP